MKFTPVVLAAALLSSEANSQNLDAAAPEALSQNIRDLGYKSVLGKDSDGDPMIDSSSNGSSFRIFFRGCENGKNCDTIQFVDIWTLKKSDYIKLRQVADEWNESAAFSRIILDEETVVLTTLLLLKKPGMAPTLFASNFENWVSERALVEKQFYEGLK